MILSVQILTSFYSFLFGIFVMVGYILSKKLLNHKNIYLRILFCFLFSFGYTVIYYLVMENINDGVIHPYGLGIAFLSGIIFYILQKKKSNI